MSQQLMENFPQEAKDPAADLMKEIDWYKEGGGDYQVGMEKCCAQH
jgi:hypothetical protein